MGRSSIMQTSMWVKVTLYVVVTYRAVFSFFADVWFKTDPHAARSLEKQQKKQRNTLFPHSLISKANIPPHQIYINWQTSSAMLGPKRWISHITRSITNFAKLRRLRIVFFSNRLAVILSHPTISLTQHKSKLPKVTTFYYGRRGGAEDLFKQDRWCGLKQTLARAHNVRGAEIFPQYGVSKLVKICGRVSFDKDKRRLSRNSVQIFGQASQRETISHHHLRIDHE